VTPLLARSTPVESRSTLAASSSNCCSTVNILAVSVGGFDSPRGFVVLVVVDLGCGGGGGRGLVAAEILVLVARSMESQSNTGKKFFPRSASASTGPGSDTRCNDPGEDHVWFEDRWMVACLCDE
jgi:hypothetical protein